MTAGQSLRKRLRRCCWLRLGLSGLLASLVGCGSSPDVVSFSQSEKNLTHIAMAYGDAESKLGRPPKNADELKPFLKEFGNPDDLLVSPVDGEPYVIAFGSATGGGPTEYMGMFPILAYEKKGGGGKRAITDTRGRPMNIPQADFAKLTFVRGHKPSS